MHRRLRSRRVGATLVLYLLAASFLVTMAVAGIPSRAASGAPANPLLYDDFTHDTSLNASLWQINGPVGMNFGQDEVGVNVIALAPTFSSQGMLIDQVNRSQEEGTIQSIANFTPPFTATALVEGTVSNGHTFGFAISSADASTGITVYGNLNPQNCSHLGDCGVPSTCGISANSTIPPNQCYYGIDAKVGTNGSSWTSHGKLYLTPSVNVFYTLQISVDASGNAWYAVSQGGQLLGAINEQVGTGPFWVILYQGEGSPVESPGPNQAYWQSVNVAPVATSFSTTTIASTTSTSPAPTTSGIPTFVWLIIIAVVVILFLILLLWSRRRNLTIRVQDQQTLSPIVEGVASADGPEKLRGFTDKKGEITFKSVEKGDYVIRAEAKGYLASAPVKVEVKKTADFTVRLERSAPSVSPGAGGVTPPSVPGGEAAVSPEVKPTMEAPAPTTQAPSPPAPAPPAAVIQPVPAPPPPEQGEEEEMGGFGGGRIAEIIRTFQAKGAISPETALTADELGLSRLFVRIMKRRKGRTRIFVEVNGRYYLNQEAVKDAQ